VNEYIYDNEVRTAIAVLLSGACGRVHFEALDTSSGGVTDDSATIPGAVTTEISATGYCPSLAWSGSVLGVTWLENVGPSYPTMFASFDVAGQPVQAPMLVGNSLTPASCSALEWATDHFLAAVEIYTNQTDINVANISSSVGPLTNITNDMGLSQEAELAARGTQLVLTWYDNRSSQNDQIYALALSDTGVPGGLPFQVSGAAGVNSWPMVTPTAAGFIIAWTGDASLHLRMLDPTGALSSSEIAIPNTSTIGRTMAVATAGDTIVAWSHGVARIDGAGNVTAGPFALTGSAGDIVGMDWSGTDARLVMTRDTGYYVATLAATGEPLSETRLADNNLYTQAPIRWIGDRYAVVYGNDAGVSLTILPP